VVVKLDSITEVRPLIGGTAEVVLNNGATLEVSRRRVKECWSAWTAVSTHPHHHSALAGMTATGRHGKMELPANQARQTRAGREAIRRPTHYSGVWLIGPIAKFAARVIPLTGSG